MLKNMRVLLVSWLFPLAAVVSSACSSSNSSAPAPDDQASGDASAPPRQDDGGSGEGGPRTGPIAPDCTEALAWCAQGHAYANLSCKDVDGKPYTITTTFSGKTDNVSCAVDERDLALIVGPPQADTEAYNTHSIRFRLRNYTGGGTYELARSADEGSGHGFELQGAAGGSQADERSAVAATMACGPSPCRAIVAPESEPFPNDDSVREFRLRVEIQCDAAGKLWWHPDCNGTDCNLTSAPTIYFDIQCSH
ncbi:MAG: hypothetical protein BGO98_14470 [Myxococcales bacterium 68-20]|nr:MAG: hypothetical protein BGO98_14470 [Myxococcales bacterium 68-20]